MKYRIVKPDYDGRFFTHHVVLPDGYYRIFNLTRHNHDNLESLIRRGYEIEEYTGPLAGGLYEEGTDMRVDPASVMQKASPAFAGSPISYLDQEAPDDSETLGIRPREFRQVRRQRLTDEQVRGNKTQDLRDSLSALKVGYRASDSASALEAKLQKALAKAN